MGNCIKDREGLKAMKLSHGILKMVPGGDIAGQVMEGVEGAANVVEAV